MKRLVRQIAAAVTIALAGSICAAVVWLAVSTEGARWLLKSVSQLSGGTYSVQQVEGSIIDRLLLRGVRVGLAQQTVEIKRLEVNWTPLALITGTVTVNNVTLTGVQIQDDTPPDDKAPLLLWPKAPEIGRMFTGRIARLQVTELSYRRLQEKPMQVTDITTAVTWQDGTLSLKDLNASSPSGQIHGNISAGFVRPSLLTNLVVAMTQPIAEMDTFSLQLQHSQSADDEQLAGKMTVAGSAGSRKLMELSGEVGLTPTALNLRHLRLSRPGQRSLIGADGSFALTKPDSALTLRVTAADLNLSPELPVPTDISGILTFTGTVNSYQGDFTLTNRAHGWQAVTVSSSYHGTRSGVQLPRITARILDGTVAGKLDIDWRNGFSVQGALHGRDLNPSKIEPDWKGVANFKVAGELAWSGTKRVTGSVHGALLESRLHNQALTGEFKADWADNNLSVSRLTLQGKGFDIHASGRLERRLAVDVQISDVSRLVPGSSGALQAAGWLCWRNGHLSGAATGTGSTLAYDGMRIAAANLTARLDQGTDYPFHVAASLQNAAYNSTVFTAVTIAVDGTLPHHTVNAMLHSAEAEAKLTLRAGYTDTLWKGEITTVTGSDGVGGWNLVAPTPFVITAKNISVAPLALSSGPGERLDVAVNLALSPVSGKIQVHMTEIDLVRLKPWLPRETRLEGRISGRATGLIRPGKTFEVDGSAELSGGVIHQQSAGGDLNLAFSSATTSWGWRGEALSGSLALVMAEYGQARGTFYVPIPARFPLAINVKKPLRAVVVGQLRDKGIITALFPGLVHESSGELDAELTLGGNWKEPQLGGKLSMSKAGAYLPTAGIHLTDVKLAARLEKNLIRIDSFRASSGPGHIEGNALITLANWHVTGYQGTIGGDNFQAVDFPEMQIRIAPQLNFSGTPQKLTLRGELHLPELHIVATPGQSAIAPSGDVIREGKIVPVAQSPPLDLDIEIKVQLDDKAVVKIAGIDALLGGAVDLSFSRLDTITSRGEIKVIKGNYRTYGVNLEIVRGRLFFAGGTIDNPTLDFLALRSIGDVRAGVLVSGNLQKPVTRLYSEPAMPDIDILAYIVLGHPLSGNGEQASLIAQAASALLTSGQAGVLREQIQNHLGLSTLSIQGGVGSSTTSMGYRPLQVTAPGTIPADQQPGITETIVTAGKYLTPQLYVSYGRSLFTGNNVFLLRYDIFKRWQIETQTGSESGVDLFYTFKFK